MTDKQFNDSYQYCIKLLARREYSRYELQQKLSQQDFDKSIIDKCLDYLLEENYQSDERFTEMYCRTRISQRYGKLKIAYELKQKGINEYLINDNISKYEDTYLENAIHLIKRKATTNNIKKFFSDFSLKSKITRFLVGKGYDYDTINLAFDTIKSEEE